MVHVRWTGAAGLEIRHEEHTYLIDPYHSRPGKFEVAFGRLRPRPDRIARALSDIPRGPQAIIVGHTHFDHALDIPEIAKTFRGPIIGSRSLDTLMTIHGMKNRITVCEGGEKIQLPGGAVATMIPVPHGLVMFGRVPYPGEVDPDAMPPLRGSDYRHGRVFAVKLEIGGLTLLQMGSANLIDEALDGHVCDVLFLCVPGWNRIENLHERILSRTKPKIVVPFHFDDFTARLAPDRSAPNLPFQKQEAFLKSLRNVLPSVKIITPHLYQALEFGQP